MARSVAPLALALLLLVGASVASALSIGGAKHRGALNHGLTDHQLRATRADLPPQWHTQNLDHGNLANTDTFPQRYFVNDSAWDATRPLVFLMIGGEGPLSPAYVSGHFYMTELAAQFGALQVALEHRFYGESVPNNDSSVGNLRYLTEAQALDDLVTFRQHINQQYPAATGAAPVKWITFGGSYSGALSAWARLKFPNLFQGAFSTSAPLEAILDFNEYLEITATSLGPQVNASLAAATATLTDLLSNTQGRAALQEQFNLCSPIETDLDVANFLSVVRDVYAEVVQYDDDSVALMEFDVKTIQSITSHYAVEDGYAALVAVWNNYTYGFNHQSGCTDTSYTGLIKSMQQTGAARSWTYQTCTAFGYFQSGSGSTQPFSPLISLDYYLQQCQDLFGAPLTPNVNFINEIYGGSQIVTSNTVFTTGSVDPWHALGNYQVYDASSQSAAIYIQGTAHCRDMYAPRADDPPQLTAARMAQVALLTEWISDKKPQQSSPRVALE